MSDVQITTPDQAAPRRARHLMDPNALEAPRDRVEAQRKFTNVQRWVTSVLAVSTILHLAFGIILATKAIDNPQPGAAEMLCVLAGAFGVLAVLAARLIHGKSLVSWWLLLGVIPTLIGLWYIN